MALTSAERQQRSRKHKAGDHSLCDPGRCESAGAPLPPALDADALASRGRRLWREMTAAAELGPAQLVLLEEACRITDRLDRLDKVLRRRDDAAWLEIQSADGEGRVLRVVVDNALSEARHQATALRGLIAELTKTAARSPAPPAAGGRGVQPPAGDQPPAPDPLDELRQRAKERREGRSVS